VLSISPITALDRIHRDLDDSVLKRAFEETLNILSQRMKESVIYDLQNAGEYSREAELSLEKIALRLNRLFGKEAAQIIPKRMFLTLDELAVMAKKQNKEKSLAPSSCPRISRTLYSANNYDTCYY
jgi:hypothetical protein